MTSAHLTVVNGAPDTPPSPADDLADEPTATNDTESGTDTIVVPPCPRIPLSLLAPHPDNKREDLDLNDEFVASIRDGGITDPIEVVPLPDDDPGSTGTGDGQRPRFRIVDGHRRYFGALQAEVADAPVFLSGSRADDRAGQYLTMFTSSRHTSRLTPAEEANALFAASEAGATQTVIRRKTGLSKDDVRTAIKAGGLSPETKAKADHGLTIDQLALLAEFEDDEDALGEVLNGIRFAGTGQHAAERIRQRRAVKAEADAARERYAADGFQVTDALPDGAVYLMMLLQDDEELTPEAHAACPGRGILILDSDPDGSFYCTDPDAYGHAHRFTFRNTGEGTGDEGDSSTEESGPDSTARQLVREGNVAWTAAGEVRRRWLKNLCARATLPREAQLFAAQQILIMPPSVAARLSSARNEELFGELTSRATPERLNGWKPGKLPLIQLALVLTAYEDLLTGASGKLCWRPAEDHRFPPVARQDAGAYFAGLAALGYQLSTIEQALAGNVPYEGEPSADEPTAEAEDA